MRAIYQTGRETVYLIIVLAVGIDQVEVDPIDMNRRMPSFSSEVMGELTPPFSTILVKLTSNYF